MVQFLCFFTKFLQERRLVIPRRYGTATSIITELLKAAVKTPFVRKYDYLSSLVFYQMFMLDLV